MAFPPSGRGQRLAIQTVTHLFQTLVSFHAKLINGMEMEMAAFLFCFLDRFLCNSCWPGTCYITEYNLELLILLLLSLECWDHRGMVPCLVYAVLAGARTQEILHTKQAQATSQPTEPHLSMGHLSFQGLTWICHTLTAVLMLYNNTFLLTILDVTQKYLCIGRGMWVQVPEGDRGLTSPWSYRWLMSPQMWVLGTKFGSSTEAVCVLNCWAFFFFLLKSQSSYLLIAI